MIASLAIKNAAPYWLVTQFFISGVIFFLLGSVAFILSDFSVVSILSMKMIGVMHLLLLGFVMSIIFGAVYQLLSVVLEVPIYSSTLGYLQFIMYIIGLGLFLASLFNSDATYITYGALILYMSILIYSANIFISLKAIQDWGVKAYFILIAHIFLAIGVTYGLLISFDITFGVFGFELDKVIHKHASITIIGYIFEIIFAISSLLVPMFMLSHEFNEKISKPILFVSSLAVISYLSSFFSAAYILFILSVAMFIYQIGDIYQKRVRKISDIYSLHIITSIFWLIISIGILIYSYIGFNEIALKILSVVGIFGFFGFFMVGHIYKIVPFLVWNKKFAPLVGKEKIPMLSDMLHVSSTYIEFYIKNLAILALIFAIITKDSITIYIAAVLLIISALLVVYNTIYIFRYTIHKFKEKDNE